MRGERTWTKLAQILFTFALVIASASKLPDSASKLPDIDYDKGQRRSIAMDCEKPSPSLAGWKVKTWVREIDEIKSLLAKEVKLPPGMTIEYGGLYQEQQSSFRELAISLVLAIVLVFITLLIEFRSYAHPIAILTGVLALGVYCLRSSSPARRSTSFR